MAAALPIIALVVTAASAGVSAYGALRAGREEEKESERAATERIVASRREAEDTRKRHRAIMASQRARYGAAGVTMEGTPLLMQIESQRESEEELSRIIESGLRESYAEERAGRRARTAGAIGAGGELLAGAGGVMRAGRSFDWW